MYQVESLIYVMLVYSFGVGGEGDRGRGKHVKSLNTKDFITNTYEKKFTLQCHLTKKGGGGGQKTGQFHFFFCFNEFFPCLVDFGCRLFD